MEKKVLDLLNGKKIYFIKTGYGSDNQGDGEIYTYTLGEVNYIEKSNDPTVVFLVTCEDGRNSSLHLKLREWEELYNEGYYTQNRVWHYSMDKARLEHIQMEYLKGRIRGELYTDDWDTRAWQLACQLFAQSWNMPADEEKKMELCVEYSYKFIDVFKEKATEIGVNKLKETFNNSNN